MTIAHNSAVAVCAAFVAQFVHGSIVPKSWFYDQFGYDPADDSNVETQRYARAMALIHDALRRDHHMVLEDIEGDYRIAEPHRHAEIAQRRVKRGINAAFVEGESVISATDLNQLDGEQRRALTDAGNRISGMKELLDKPRRNGLE